MAAISTVPHVPTDETRLLIAELSSFGITHEQMASRLDICVETLNKYYKKELVDGKCKVIQQVARRLVDKALDGDSSSQMFYLKTQAGWREKDKEDDNKPKPESEIYALRKL
jgi:plasmid maintenance system antidote protein VapI